MVPPDPQGAWPVQPAGRVPLLDVDPDLGAGSEDQRIVTPVLRFAAGRIPAAPAPAAGSLGYLVLKGRSIYEGAVCGRAAAEMLGPGDVIRPGATGSGTLGITISWTALEPTLVADLSGVDAPHVVGALAVRYAERAERLAIERSIGAHVRVDVRVLAYLWHLADRFGVVVPGGVRLDLPLTHAVLARLIGARRPTVTTALQRLAQLGYITREGRAFRLLGDGAAVEDLDRRSPAHEFEYAPTSG